MNKCHVDILLRGREEVIQCIWEGPETTSTEVAVALLEKNRAQDFYGLLGEDNHNIIVRVGDIVCLDIYAM